ncbi:Dual specificity protein phosphatase 3 [Varanus komodoensis]|nr:Dual specificity protein phosphatase 3 [Varanus komodoensis]
MIALSLWDVAVLTGSCPDLVMNKNDVLEKKSSREASSTFQARMKTHRALCSSLSSDSPRQYRGLVSPEHLDAQMKQVHSGGAARSTGSLERKSLFCASSLSRSILPKPVEPLSKVPSSTQSSSLLCNGGGNSLESDSSPLSVSDYKKSHNENLKSGTNPGGTQGFSFLEPVISKVTDCIYVGNLRAAYSGRALCKNNIDSIIDMSSLPGDYGLNFIPCTCGRGPQHSWPRLKVYLQGPLEEECLSLQQPCFWDINECIEASLEKRKRVLIHCRDGYSLAPTCVIQYLMVKHHMRLLAAYGFVRARHPVNIQECHRNLLVGLERALWPGEVDMESFKQAMSRKVAWT